MSACIPSLEPKMDMILNTFTQKNRTYTRTVSKSFDMFISLMLCLSTPRGGNNCLREIA